MGNSLPYLSCVDFQGASGRAHPVFAFSPLVRDSQPRSSNIPPVRRSESVQHTPAGKQQIVLHRLSVLHLHSTRPHRPNAQPFRLL